MSSLVAALGRTPGERLIVLHQGDVGLCHSANAAFVELFRRGGITCGSAIVPSPWFPEIAAIAAADRDLDLGIQLTLTSEWQHYRWGPVSAAGHRLCDEHGYFPRGVAELRRRLDLDAAEAELRAQIDRAIAMGMRPTHLDSHMGVGLAPELRSLYVRLGRDYRLPVVLPRDFEAYSSQLDFGALSRDDSAQYSALLSAAAQPPFDTVRFLAGRGGTDVMPAYRGLLGSAKPGVGFVALRCSTAGDIETIAPAAAAARINEHKLFRSPTAAAWLKQSGIVAIGMREIQRVQFA